MQLRMAELVPEIFPVPLSSASEAQFIEHFLECPCSLFSRHEFSHRGVPGGECCTLGILKASCILHGACVVYLVESWGPHQHRQGVPGQCLLPPCLGPIMAQGSDEDADALGGDIAAQVSDF